MKTKTAYPWFYFLRVSRLSFIVFLPALIFILILYRSSYKEGLLEQMIIQEKEDLGNVRDLLEKSRLSPQEWCEAKKDQAKVRYSLVNKQSISLCDSKAEEVGKKIEDTSEIDGAFLHGFAARVHTSKDFHSSAIFAAQKFSPDLVLRKVIPVSSFTSNLSHFDQRIFFQIIPIAVISYIFFIILFYQATKPLGTILSRVEKFQANIPYKQTLRQHQRDKWAQIEAALHQTDQKLQDQVNQVKLENEKIGTILESIYDDIIAIDPFETILFFNSNFNKNFVRGRSLGEILPKIWHVFTDEQILKSFRRVLKSGENVNLKGLQLLENRYFDLTVTPLKDVNGHIMGALGVFYDVTEFKLTEQMRVDFVANVSHEIRTPLTSIKGYSQVLQGQKDKLPADLSPFLDKILTNTERMISLFNDLLNLSVIESKFDLKKEDLKLQEMVESIADGIATMYPEKKIEFSYDLKLENIRGDQRLMEQVLSNLIDNACKYSTHNLAIKFSSYLHEGKARVVVTDNGPGISPEHLPRIFERFYRIDSSRETSRGTGLGLSIVKHILARHGGRIWAESAGDGGSSFILELPLE